MLLAGAYIVGSIPTGYWYAKFLYDIDVMQHGSGNIGATNVARVLKSKKHFFVIFLIDALKAYAMLLGAARVLEPNTLLFVACALVLGNGHSLFLQFRGGKGVATVLGVLLALANMSVLLTFVGAWFVVLALFRLVDYASLAASSVLVPAQIWFIGTGEWEKLLFLGILTGWIIIRHKKNIYRLLYKDTDGK